jgi:hypothetical protein
VAALAALFLASRSAAQAAVTTEARADVVVARRTAIEGGLSLVVPAGIYVRTSLSAAAGAANYPSGSALVGRAEIVSRFLLDPFREARYGLSIGGGVGATNIGDGEKWRPYLAVVLDLELQRTARLMPAVQLGLGGGARLGVVLRRSSGQWR